MSAQVPILVEVTDLSRFGGHQGPTLEGLNFSVQTGVLSILGPTQAGKSTLLAILAGRLRPSSGQAYIGQVNVVREPREAARLVGYVSPSPSFPGNLTVVQTLEYFALLKGVGSKPQRQTRVDEALFRLDLGALRNTRLRALPEWDRRRVALAQACLTRPTVLLVDEPTKDLHPLERQEMLLCLARLAGETLMLFTTSEVDDVTALATSVLVLDRGRQQYQGTPSELLAQLEGRTWIAPATLGTSPSMGNGFVLTGLFRVGDRHSYRGVGPEPPSLEALPTPPTFQDAYIWLLSLSGRTGGLP